MSEISAIPITLTVNDEEISTEVKPWETLLDFLRDRLDLTGAKRSCDIQICGACTVLLDGQPVSACCTLVYEARGREVLTIEGLAQGQALHPVQEAFLEQYALQCGFCTPGMVLTATALLSENPDPGEEEIRHYMRGNLCRCTGYYSIVEAVRSAADGLQKREEAHSE